MCVALLSSLLFAAAAGPASPVPVQIGDRETIVFYGDSITEQNLYTAYLETFLLSRFPKKDLAFFNLGWSGDTASGGYKRFARDVLPVHPSLVFVNFGMNDGGYKAYWRTRSGRPAPGRCSSRPLRLTTSCARTRVSTTKRSRAWRSASASFRPNAGCR
jgi:lysophospholipase L1-like esterase